MNANRHKVSLRGVWKWFELDSSNSFTIWRIYFFLRFFYMGHFLKCLLEFVNILLLILFFGFLDMRQ